MLAALTTILIVIVAGRSNIDKARQATQQTNVSDVGQPPSCSEPTNAPEDEIEPTEQPWTPSEADVEYIAKTIYGEAGIVESDMQRAAVAWCILNRVDSDKYPDTIEDVVTAKYQFLGYNPDNPVTEDLRNLAVDVLQRWHSEQDGEAEVGRVLPSDYTFFWGDGYENYFTNEWKSTDYWEWSMDNPYEN
jgi:hypothetical protein